MSGQQNSIARLLAPIALVAAFLAFVIVIASSGGGDGGGGGEPQSQREDSKGGSEKTVTEDTTYIVKPGDSLGAIAEKTGIPVKRLTELNPDIDPQALISGQCVALTAPSECK